MQTLGIALATCLLFFSEAHAQEPGALAAKVAGTFSARDTLDCGDDASTDAKACLDGLKWAGGTFTVQCDAQKPESGDALLRFPTPRPSGDATNDLVAMEWHMVTDEKGEPKRAPAMVVVHESGRGMVAGRIFASGLKAQGFHAFLVHLPGYGARTSGFTQDIHQMLPAMKQAVADVRRARDAAVALPQVDGAAVGLAGISLGGFVTAAVAGLDRGYDKCFVLLAGGNLSDVLLNGGRDAASTRKQLTDAGITEQQIKEHSLVIEPLRLAHRVNPTHTWLFTAKFDEVVPMSCAEAYAKAAKLSPEHHVVLPCGHYSAALHLPAMLAKIAGLMRGEAAKATP